MEFKVAVTGVSSFTGSAIAKALAQAGMQVHGLIHSSGATADQLKSLRLDDIEGLVQLHSDLQAEGNRILEWIKQNRPGVWIHHHHHMDQFRSETGYDVERMKKTCLDPLPGLVRCLAANGCQAIIYSGSYFEPEEAGPTASGLRVTPYSLSKRQVWLDLVRLADQYQLSVHKIIIPNPIGVFENQDRLIPNYLKATLREDPQFVVRDAMSVADNIPIPFLCQAYRQLVRSLTLSEAKTMDTQIIRPSYWVCTHQQLLEKVQKEIIQDRWKKSAPALEIVPSPMSIQRKNCDVIRTDPAVEAEFWQSYADHFSRVAETNHT